MLLPRSIQIQTIDYCNRKCAWCPNSKMRKSPDDLMPEEIFVKILSDLKKADYEGKIHLYLMAEPLWDPRIHRLIKMARMAFTENVIFLSTNGDCLTSEEDIEKLLDAGLTWMAISNYEENGRLPKLAKPFPEVVCTPISFLKKTYYNRAGNIDVKCENPQERCDWVFGKAYVNYQGEVILCCSDYNYQIKFGNVMDRSFPEIYNSFEYRYYRREHAQGRGKALPLCQECNRIK